MFVSKLSQILEYTKEEAIRTGWQIMTPNHFALGLLRHMDNAACEFLLEHGINLGRLKQRITGMVEQQSILPEAEWNNVTISPELKNMLEASSHIISEDKNHEETLVYLIFLQQMDSSCLKELLPEYGVTPELVMDKIQEYRPTDKAMESTNPEDLLTEFGRDLVKDAEDGKLDPVVCRDKEIERIIEVLNRRKKCNPLIVGESGSGKTALIEGLAMRIAEGNVPFTLLGRSIISLDIISIVAGTKFRGDFESKMQSILNAVKEHPEVIVFIDELHTLVGAGGQNGAIDAAEMVKQAIAKGELQCIGTTTPDEFRKVIEKDSSLERRFQKINIEPPTPAQTVEILRKVAPKYENFHNVQYGDDAIEACISLSTKYITHRSLPDKAIDLLDEAGAKATAGRCTVPDEFYRLADKLHKIREKKRIAIANDNSASAATQRKAEIKTEDKIHELIHRVRYPKNRQMITAEDIQNVTAEITGIPVSKIAQSESRRLLDMSETLKHKVIGQDYAVENVVKALIRSRAGLKDPDKPIGTFLFLGPTGVGKTHLAKLIAEYLFDTPDAIIRLDMSEYMDKFTVSRLIGAPPGYLGYNDGGQLSNKVRQKPYSVVLLDEIEKAHPDIFNLLLQILDEGRLTDSSGTYVDFRNTVLIMTSNVGSRDLNDFGQGVGFSSGSFAETGYNKKIIDKALCKVFSPEFLNRLDDIIYFNKLGMEEISKIVDIEMSGLYRRAEEAGFPITLTDRAKEFLCKKSYDIKFGARPLKRAISHYVEDVVAEAIISGDHSKGILITLDLAPAKDRLLIAPHHALGHAQ